MRRWLLWLFLLGVVAPALGLEGLLLWEYHGPAAATPIFQGITYGCEVLPETPQSGGLFHWVRADLNVPGVSLFVTPKDPEAMASGFEYRLKYTSTAVTEDNLAAAVNGTLFVSSSHGVRLPGDLANSCETTVADHVANHVDPNSYLMWWDDDRIGHLEHWKPPPTASLLAAKWGISGQEWLLWGPERAANTLADERTVIAIDPVRKLVWICCFDKASYNFISIFLKARGAKGIIAVDGGTSKAMAIGRGAKNIRPGTVTGNWRPVATQFGFRALPLP